MKEYIFYTFEGFTQSPTGKGVENMQILGIEYGASQESAKATLLSNNKWIEEYGYDDTKILSRQLSSSNDLQ